MPARIDGRAWRHRVVFAQRLPIALDLRQRLKIIVLRRESIEMTFGFSASCVHHLCTPQFVGVEPTLIVLPHTVC